MAPNATAINSRARSTYSHLRGSSIGLLHCSLKQQSRRSLFNPAALRCRPHTMPKFGTEAFLGVCQTRSGPPSVRPEASIRPEQSCLKQRRIEICAKRVRASGATRGGKRRGEGMFSKVGHQTFWWPKSQHSELIPRPSLEGAAHNPTTGSQSASLIQVNKDALGLTP